MHTIGQKAPTFNLSDQDGQMHSLESYRGKWVVLYFYPKDDTPGCTKEACNFRDEKGKLEEMGAVVLGVSADDVKSHHKFHGKYGLNFPLLADPDLDTIKAYGSWGSKTMFGNTFDGILRQTFLIDPQGKIAHIWETVDTEAHALEVAQVLAALQK